MAPVIGGLQRSVTSIHERLLSILRAARARNRPLDHLGRAYGRYKEKRGDRLAAALSFYGVISFFPLVALAFAITGYAVAISPKVRDAVAKAMDQILPGLADKLPVHEIASAKAGASLIALVGLAWSGLGWIGVWRESLRLIWRRDVSDGNLVVNKLWDLIVLFMLGLALIASVILSSLTTSATHVVLGWIGLTGVPGAGTFLRLIAIAVAIGANTLIFLVLFSQLAGTKASWRHLVRGCVFGAVGFEVLKLVGTYLVAHTMRNPVYASFAVIAGLMVWINISTRFILFTAAWTATRRVILSADEPTAVDS
jgi:inner membrane protein YhjD